MVKKWEVIERKTRGSFKIFDIEERIFKNPYNGKKIPSFIINSNQWVNVIAITPESEPKIVLINQFRFGSERIELEIPGGIVEDGEKPGTAAARELFEETGYKGNEPILLGKVNPNPAIHGHICYTYLIEGAYKSSEPRFDGPNEVCDVVLASVPGVKKLVQGGKITHSLVIDAIFWYLLYISNI